MVSCAGEGAHVVGISCLDKFYHPVHFMMFNFNKGLT